MRPMMTLMMMAPREWTYQKRMTPPRGTFVESMTKRITKTPEKMKDEEEEEEEEYKPGIDYGCIKGRKTRGRKKS